MFQRLFTAMQRCSAWSRSIVHRQLKQPVKQAHAETVMRTAWSNEVYPRTSAEITAGKERIASRIEQMQRFTNDAAIACGSVLSTVFDDVKNLIAETNQRTSASINRYEEITADFFKKIQEDSLQQEAAVMRLLRQTNSIEDAICDIDNLTQFANILAINTRIEAARFGIQGESFAVLGARMRELSGNIQQVAGRVKNAIGTVREGIPPVIERATSIRNNTQSFIDDVTKHIQLASMDTESDTKNRLEMVMGLSTKALTHLQFQDRLSQKLASINCELDMLDDRVCRIVNGETNLEKFEKTTLPGDGDAGTGSVLLF